ncbi:hypothetical protein NEOLI_004941 [Neolecta irregularis DAH-3]|uniref:Uncharacterized protein n=1 Tax=Neolecta irregularis (strain DAH-3) TaxID=1198029 RepID=A0A1U7LP88_NEOID|nr:hypothetical protein NEOLI_004941 [Neolecta irregularis DAH-3]|eukprot:OLL24464.1 hypothetical protein NEOLI_004941 [Neolecta irregularis DAH-3]
MLIICVEAGWNKLNEFYTKTDDSPAYATAVVLDPRWKWAYFKRMWIDHPEWIIQSKEQVHKFWAKKVSTMMPAITQVTIEQDKSNTSTNEFNLWVDRQMHDLSTGGESEYNIYCSEAILQTNAIPTGHQGLYFGG